jgi:hypothetical protein
LSSIVEWIQFQFNTFYEAPAMWQEVFWVLIKTHVCRKKTEITFLMGLGFQKEDIDMLESYKCYRKMDMKNRTMGVHNSQY